MIRLSRMLPVARAGFSEPARRWGTIALCGAGVLAALAFGGCAGCGNVVVQGKALTPGEIAQTAKEAGFYLIAFAGVGACGLLSLGLLSGEIGSRGIVATLARPLSRDEYLLGRAGAGAVPALVLPVSMALAFAGTFALATGVFPAPLLLAGAALAPALFLFMALSGLLGLWLPSILALAAAWGAYGLSCVLALETVRTAVLSSGNVALRTGLRALDVLLPPFGRFQGLVHSLVSGEPPPGTDWLAVPWLLGYLCALMFLAARSFRTRDL